jgi:hypothetical protein
MELQIVDEPYLTPEELVDKLISELHRHEEEFHQEYRTRLAKYRDRTLNYIKAIDSLAEFLPDLTEAISIRITAKKRYLEFINGELRSEYSGALSN